eukprot:TRINITY_DN17258_c0_g1_i2.p1 TRINITY_DN17258_c0_g1~~TRINITY_DN17258_c0_g1_i2.p1  ORF type:complete len:235 (+),score=77.71 TRINITY_DN17258_c0_g1_i2:83-787(+)
MFRLFFFFFQAEDGIRDAQESRGLGDVYKRQVSEEIAAHGFNVVTLHQLTDISPNSLVWREMDEQASGRVGKQEVLGIKSSLGIPDNQEFFENKDSGQLNKQDWDEWAKANRVSSKTSTLTRALEMTIRPSGPHAHAHKLQDSLLSLQEQLGCDLALQRSGTLRQVKRLVVMDMDSTLIQQEVIDEIARAHGVYDKVAEMTEKAMQGGMDFNESLRARCAELKGCPAEPAGERE